MHLRTVPVSPKVTQLERHRHYIQRPQVFTESTYHSQFAKDVHRAQARIFICSAYIRDRRITELQELLREAVKRNVRICVLAEQPYRWTERSSRTLDEQLAKKFQLLQESADRLLGMGIHVNLRPKVHQKIACIDDKIIWDGSLNLLSHFDSLERITRYESREMLEEATQLHDLRCDMCAALKPKDDGCELIGRALHEQRIVLGLSQLEVAEAAGVSRWIVSRVETGQDNVPISDVVAIARVLKISIRAVKDWQSDAVDSILYGR